MTVLPQVSNQAHNPSIVIASQTIPTTGLPLGTFLRQRQRLAGAPEHVSGDQREVPGIRHDAPVRSAGDKTFCRDQTS